MKWRIQKAPFCNRTFIHCSFLIAEMDSSRTAQPTYSKEMESENAMSSVRRCAVIRIESVEFVKPFECTPDILLTMCMENKRKEKLVARKFSGNNGNPTLVEINGDFKLFYSHNVKSHRDPILRFAVENTRAKTFSRHRSIAAALVSMQQIVQHDFDGVLLLYECHVPEKNPIGRIRVQIRSVYMDDQDEEEDASINSEEAGDDNLVSAVMSCMKNRARITTYQMVSHESADPSATSSRAAADCSPESITMTRQTPSSRVPTLQRIRWRRRRTPPPLPTRRKRRRNSPFLRHV